MAETIRVGTFAELGEYARQVRTAVFIVEQEIDEAEEWDEFDEAATHVVVFDDDIPVATGRIAFIDRSYHLGRIATLKKFRNNDYGSRVMEALMDCAVKNDIPCLELHAQTHAIDFYKKFGFTPFGDIFLEAGIEHVKMMKVNIQNEDSR